MFLKETMMTRSLMPMLAGALIMTATAATRVAGTPPAPPPGNPAAGKIVFAKCTMCHSVTPGQNKIGPSLGGVVGRKAGTAPAFTYSAAMKGSNLTWDAATLDRYLTNPRGVVPGTKMIFAGLPAPADRANVIAYLASAPSKP